MEATHRVKDKENNTLGFLIDGRFIASNLIKGNLSKWHIWQTGCL